MKKMFLGLLMVPCLAFGMDDQAPQQQVAEKPVLALINKIRQARRDRYWPGLVPATVGYIGGMLFGVGAAIQGDIRSVEDAQVTIYSGVYVGEVLAHMTLGKLLGVNKLYATEQEAKTELYERLEREKNDVAELCECKQLVDDNMRWDLTSYHDAYKISDALDVALAKTGNNN